MTTATAQPATCNIPNRTIFEGDNLDVMRGINDDCIDLIYLDPPFNSNRDYAAPIGSKAAGAAFKDTWDLTDVDEAWHNEIAEADLALYKVIDASEHSHGSGMKSYLNHDGGAAAGDEVDTEIDGEHLSALRRHGIALSESAQVSTERLND